MWGLLRIGLGWIFLWPFLDKLIGLGFATKPENAWLSGGSPTTGFLLHATKGPFASFFQGLANNVFVDWLFMLGLLLIGLALIFGILVKIASYSGALMLVLIYIAVLPPEHNPFLDDHIIYAAVLIGFTFIKSGHWLGFGKSWSKQKFIKKNPYLE